MSKGPSETELVIADKRKEYEKLDQKKDDRETRYRYSLTQLPVSIDDKVTIRVWNTNYCRLDPGHVSVELHGKYRAYISAWPAADYYSTCCGNLEGVDLKSVSCGYSRNWINKRIGILEKYLGFSIKGELRTQRDEYAFPAYERLHDYHHVSRMEQKQIEKNIGQVVDLYCLNTKKIYALYKKYRRYHFSTHWKDWFSIKKWENICNIEKEQPEIKCNEEEFEAFLKKNTEKAQTTEEKPISTYTYLKVNGQWTLLFTYYEKNSFKTYIEPEEKLQQRAPNLLVLLKIKDKFIERNKIGIYLKDEKSLESDLKAEHLDISIVKKDLSSQPGSISAYLISNFASEPRKFILHLSNEESQFLAQQELGKVTEFKEYSDFPEKIIEKAIIGLEKQISDIIKLYHVHKVAEHGLAWVFDKKDELGNNEGFYFAGYNAEGDLLFGPLDQIPQLSSFNQKIDNMFEELDEAKDNGQKQSIYEKYTLELMQELGFREVNNVQFKWSLFALSSNRANVSCTSLTKHLLIDGGLIDHLSYYNRPVLYRVVRSFFYFLAMAVIFLGVFLKDYLSDRRIDTLTRDLVIGIPATFGAWAFLYLLETCIGLTQSQELTPFITTTRGILRLAKKAKEVEEARWGQITLPHEQKIQIQTGDLGQSSNSERFFNSKNTEEKHNKVNQKDQFFTF